MPRILATAAVLPFLTGAAMASPAGAQDRADPYARCAAIDAADDRLACFDETYARSGELRDARERQIAERREEEFGLSVQERGELREQQADGEKAAQVAREAEDEEDEPALVAQIVEVAQDDAGRTVVQLDNGQVWRQTSGSTLRNRVRQGWTATVTRHWSGAYEMRFDERSGYLRVERIR